MAYKFFLDLEPEAKMIDPSLLTKFRKTRITEDILEEMLKETIQQALDKNLIKSGTIIVDSTHTIVSCLRKISNADSAGYEQTTGKRFIKQLLNYQSDFLRNPLWKQDWMKKLPILGNYSRFWRKGKICLK